MRKIIGLFTVLTLVLTVASCKQKKNEKKETSNEDKKIGVLLVNHGSHSENWRNTLLDLEKNVTPELEKNEEVKGIKTAFMEYNEPSIATRLKEFDKEELIKLYRDSHIFTMPSITESFGLVYAEAMTQALPVVYTKGQGFDGQFPDGEVGYSVEALNEIVRTVSGKSSWLLQAPRMSITAMAVKFKFFLLIVL